MIEYINGNNVSMMLCEKKYIIMVVIVIVMVKKIKMFFVLLVILLIIFVKLIIWIDVFLFLYWLWSCFLSFVVNVNVLRGLLVCGLILSNCVVIIV